MREALASSSWDVILSDYRMPRFSAAEALELAQGAGSEAPFIVVSGRIGEDMAVEAMRAGAYDYVMKDNLARLGATVERGLEEAKARRELRQREAILDAVRFAADQFLGEALSWEESVRTVLRRLGEAAGASRVYVFENHVGEDGELGATQRYEWAATGVSARIDNPVLKDIPYKAAGFGRWVETLGRGDLVYGQVRDFPESEQPELRAEDILSMALVPIFVEGGWWGFIGFDDCFEERDWSSAEVGALGAAAGTLGAAIRRRRTEDRLRQSEERYRAVIEQATDGIYLLDAETRRIVETNPSLQKMLGYTADELRGMEVYDFVAHPRENVESVIERTLNLRRRVVGGRRHRRKDGSLIDVEVGVSVISLDRRNVICTVVRDVTERKKNEEALRESEERFRSAFESAAIGMGLVGPDGRWIRVNRPLCDIVGYSEQELLNLTFQDITHPDDLEGDLQQVRRLLEGDIRAYQMEKRYLHKDGRTVWIMLSVSLMRDHEGNPLYFISQIEDITRRKQAEEALAYSEHRLRTIVETEPECVKVLGMDGSLLEMNPAGLSMIEADSLEQVRGKPVYEYIAPEHRADFVALTKRVLHGGSGTLEFELVGLKGTRCWLETHAVPLRDARDEISGLLAITRNITERKRNEEALKESERLYRTVIEQATENIFLIDVKSKHIVESNRAFREALGYSEEELHRMTLYDVIAADRESVDANIRRVLEQENLSVTERKYVRKDGSLLDVEVSASVIIRDGRETLVAVAHDVTERARAQRLLEERVATLSGIAGELTLDQPTETVLGALAKGVVNASTAVACGIVLIGEREGAVDLFGSHGLPEGYTSGLQEAYRAGVPSPSLEAFSSRRPVLVRDLRRFLLAHPLYSPIHSFVDEVPWDIVYSLPLVSRGQALGAIFFCFLPDQEPGEDERVFLRAVADQAAVAVENVRLFAEVRGKAALEERQKLARELHDSVSQALYGIALGVETARELLESDPESAAEPLDYTAALAEAGMTEMRALIFELRPESLEKEGLVAALEKQAAAIEARHRIRVDAALGGEPEAPLETKEALYRIAQEALHNTVKHARAGRIYLKLDLGADRIVLEVSDDGSGFDPGGSFPGHLGLKSMRERAGRLGGTLEVESRSGYGTRILAQIPSG